MQRDLTDAWLRGWRARNPGKRDEVTDARVRNLMARLSANGEIKWSVRSRMPDGSRPRGNLGSWPATGVSAARKQALSMAAAIAQGHNPTAERRALKAEKQARATLPTIAVRIVEWRDAKAAAWRDRYRREVERVCRTEILPVLGSRALVETTRTDWAALIAAKHRRAPGVGSMLYRTASSFLNHAEAHGWIDAPLLPRKGLAVIAPPVAARERVLTDEELRAIWQAAGARPPKQRTFTRLLVMTAAREMEVADIATGEIDLDGAVWRIPGTRTKNRRGIALPLHALLIDELRAVWPEHGDAAGPAWRLLGDIAGSGLRGFSKLKRHIDAASGVEGWRWHDLRRTARTGMTRLGVARDHSEAALNHVSGRSALERVYDRHQYEPEIIAALQRWQAHVAGLVTERPSAEVVPIRKRPRQARAAAG